jgi:DNA-binding NarL/FixJ family response regulator
MSQTRTAVLLDQHPLWLEAVEQLVQRVGFDVVGKTTSPPEALEMIAEHRPDVFVTALEVTQDRIDGLACLRLAREVHPELKTIVVSMYVDREHIDAALEAGADAYVIKTAHPDDLVAAVRQSFVHSMYLAGARPTRTAPKAAIPVEEDVGLTRRELEILQMVAEGHSNAQLAKMLWVTEQTVKFHLSNIYRKLDVANRTEASRWAQVRGLLPASDEAVALV